MEEGVAAVPPQTVEEEPQSRENAQANGHTSTENGGTEEHATAPKPQHKSSESKSQDTRAEAFEKQYRALQQHLRQRDRAMMELAEENEQLNKSMTELKESWKETIDGRERLVEKIKRQQTSLQNAESSLKKAQAEAVDARREAVEAKREANDARREATETSVALADAKAEIWEVQQAAKGKALGEDERRELEGALKALSASAQRASQEAGSWKENAESLKAKLESLNQELDGKANAVAVMEHDLSLARQQAKDSEIQVHEANRLQTLAESALQELRQESDRRARTFNTAVKAAVGKIQTDLESERDDALERISTLQSDLESQAESLKEANEGLTAAEQELSAATTKISQLEEERQQARDQLEKLEGKVESWKSAARASEEKAEAAHDVADGLANKVVQLETRCDELTVASESAARSAAVLEASLVADISRLKSALASAQNEKELAQAINSEKVSKLMAEQMALRATMSDLEGQLKTSQANGSTKGACPKPKSDPWLDNLGLERVNWKSKLRHQDVEKYAGKRASKDGGQPSTSYSSPWSLNQGTSILRGRMSQRSMVMIIYIVVLHILVMVSFTQRSQKCQELVTKLPG
ncbi:unnamed protein product [Calypogeia fissa]